MLKNLVFFFGAVGSAFAFSPLRPQSVRLSHTTIGRHTQRLQSSIIDVDESSFKSILEENDVVLLDICAPWCGPCKLIEPVLDRCGKRWGDALTIARYDIEQKSLAVKIELVRQEALPKKLPSLILFQNGKVVAKRAGVVNDDSLDEFLEESLAVDVGADDNEVESRSGLISFAQAKDDYMLSSP
uniref:Thioredoxin domain-containing protein n=1 Tax=Trieres chinensis TaxID=1514140 RepID=A0A7S2EAJ4_TRICV|mmetsp:Transcript_14587/g.29957  ORF Transcript_14587/g.29957 Transcript_14587/m.29957 type:complete len:185 (+) Transcript_14587:188-742(+)|eukprot:CAMPEP_0183307794 /NCGR_PEP_ID=MMETSP0160_2-20130417/19415_1 /TAXON_ID=2839 ORGANISM="Odontella Sinensis, Strain Grunow 1884" /NCGR_SAMPLE_ID=MMETSP0160_2 /ASSEMBLY_ACC=CAM_ASM_000250 /LENGTH=184 /DNA_ID=CAMNT_0025471463 /DNA_START=123 /DNA_END=677 /DNA_ORIENTATION=+